MWQNVICAEIQTETIFSRRQVYKELDGCILSIVQNTVFVSKRAHLHHLLFYQQKRYNRSERKLKCLTSPGVPVNPKSPYCRCMILSINSTFNYVFYSNAAYMFVMCQWKLLTYLITYLFNVCAVQWLSFLLLYWMTWAWPDEVRVPGQKSDKLKVKTATIPNGDRIRGPETATEKCGKTASKDSKMLKLNSHFAQLGDMITINWATQPQHTCGRILTVIPSRK